MAGIWDSLQYGNICNYEPGKLTIESLNEAIKVLYSKQRPTTTTLYVGNLGYNFFNFHVDCLSLGIDFIKHTTWFRRLKKFLYCSLFAKNGLWKLRVEVDKDDYHKYKLYYGTELKYQSSTLNFLKTFDFGEDIQKRLSQTYRISGYYCLS